MGGVMHGVTSFTPISRNRYPEVVAINKEKGLSERFFAKPVLPAPVLQAEVSVVEGLSMTWLGGRTENRTSRCDFWVRLSF
jgi:hypothetical protein